jgi:hypothetical protein
MVKVLVFLGTVAAACIGYLNIKWNLLTKV